MNKPVINVTPLIDVLLVLLIIFMVVSPLKPTTFEAKIPQPPKDMEGAKSPPLALIVVLENDSSLRLNTEENLGTPDDTEKLVERLKTVFEQRKANAVYSENAALDTKLSEDEKIEKTVFIKAPRAADYGKVAKIIDAVKLSGAHPISLQIDDLP
ncbi:MAG TPA: biopolymer transporter ExbD [Pyrinomonadaceae bacterium]|jgi:biopolymer transport protein ExbD